MNLEIQVKNKLGLLEGVAMPQENKRIIREYINELTARGISVSVRLQTLRMLIELGPKGPLKLRDGSEPAALKGIVTGYLSDLKGRMKDSTMMLYRIRLKQFFRRIYNMPKGTYPDCVSWITIGSVSYSHAGKELLTWPDVFAMAKYADNARDAVLPIFLFEVGCRANECLGASLKDLRIVNDKLAYVTLKSSKRGVGDVKRELLISRCVQRLMAWKDLHARRTEPNAPLWVCVSYNITGESLTHQGLTHILARLAKRAGIKKPVNPHWFRHSSASYYSQQGYNEAMLRDRFAWKSGSKMPGLYVNDSGEQKKFRAISGLEEEKHEAPFEAPEMPVCKVCGTYVGEIKGRLPEICSRCNRPWQQEPPGTAKELEAMKEALRQTQEYQKDMMETMKRMGLRIKK